MAKCAICNSKKGKRQCHISDGPVCSLCCGKTRTEELCSACQYYQKPKRSYTNVPTYSVPEMDRSETLESYGNSIEGALCSYDNEMGNKLKDSEAIRIIESLIDVYHFGDVEFEKSDPIVFEGANYINAVIKSDLEGVDNDIVLKILGVIRFVARRRTKIGREYMTIIHQYVGTRVGKGIRALKLDLD